MYCCDRSLKIVLVQFARGKHLCKATIALDNYQLYQQQQQLLTELKQTNQPLQVEIQERQQLDQEVLYLAEMGELAAMIVHP